RVSLETDLPDTPLQVEGDPARLVQVLNNLLNNALKFTPKGTVTVALRQVGDEVHLAVADTGIGIDADNQTRIFDRFFQVDGTATRRAEGMGLGLAIVRSIVEDGHNGRLLVQSTPGHGTT